MKYFKVSLFLLAVVAVVIHAHPSDSSAEEEKRLIQVSETEPAAWLSQEEILLLISNNIHFMDVTNRKYPITKHDSSARAVFPASMRFQSTVRNSFPNIDVAYMEAVMGTLVTFTNRYYNSQLGAASSDWLLNLITQSISLIEYPGNVSVKPFVHSWPQNSIIATIQGTESGVVIIGAHQDSINSQNPVNGVAPGADDNASGSVALLETFLDLLESGFIPKKTIEFHWYAAEEVGLRGSQDIAEAYLEQGVDVVSMLNFDVVGYHTGTNRIAFRHDYTDSDLNTFISLVVEEYLDFTLTDGECGYACSDHASWNRFGFPAAFFKESVSFPDMHTDRDTFNRVDFVQIREFVKLALGYLIELAEPASQ